MLPTDPKEAAKLGNAWGSVLTDSIFGIVDIFRNRKQLKETANKKVQAHNALQEFKNQKIRMHNYEVQKMLNQQIADEERSMLARMTPAERQQYHKQKAEAAKEQARQAREEERAREERNELIMLVFVLFGVLPVLIYVFLIMITIFVKMNHDYSTYQMLHTLVPFI